MTLQGKLALLEEILEADDGTLKVEDRLEDIDEWDSMSKLYLVSYVKKEMNKREKDRLVAAFVGEKNMRTPLT